MKLLWNYCNKPSYRPYYKRQTPETLSGNGTAFQLFSFYTSKITQTFLHEKHTINLQLCFGHHPWCEAYIPCTIAYLNFTWTLPSRPTSRVIDICHGWWKRFSNNFPLTLTRNNLSKRSTQRNKSYFCMDYI